MKISKKDLRRIILENLSEKKLLKEANLRKIRKSFIDSKKNPDDSDLLDTLAKYSEDMRTAKDTDTGPFRKGKNNPRYDEANVLLTRIEDYLAGKKGTEVPPISDETGDAVVPETPAPQEGGGSKGWKKYTETGNWEYQIQGDTPNQIWVTRKAGQEKEYRLDRPNFRDTVLKLDGTVDPEVAKKAKLPPRTPASIENCPALKPAPKSKTNEPKKEKPQSSSSTNSNTDNSNSEEPSKSKNIPGPMTFEKTDMDFLRKVNRYSYTNNINLNNKPGSMTFDTTTEAKRKAAIKKVIDWLYEQDIYTGSGGDLSDIPGNKRIYLDNALKVHKKWKDDSFKEYKKILNLSRNPVGDPTVASRWKTVLNYTYELFSRINDRYYGEQRKAKNESFSHGYLIRKRYWGRY